MEASNEALKSDMKVGFALMREELARRELPMLLVVAGMLALAVFGLGFLMRLPAV